MAKETEPKTYRVSAEVDTALRSLAKIHGGVDRALRHMLSAGGVFEPASAKPDGGAGKVFKIDRGKTEQYETKPFKRPLLKPSER